MTDENGELNIIKPFWGPFHFVYNLLSFGTALAPILFVHQPPLYFPTLGYFYLFNAQMFLFSCTNSSIQNI